MSNSLQKTKFNSMDWLLIIGLIFAPMTSLRLWKIGPSEFFLFLWIFSIFLLYKNKKIVVNYIMKFWKNFIVLLTIGTSVSIFFYNFSIPDISSIFTYIFFFLFNFSLIVFYQNTSKKKIYKILETLYFLLAFLFSFIYIYGKFVNGLFLGIPLWFGQIRFTGGALNPHQFAYTSGPMIIIGLYIINKTNKKDIKKIGLAILGIIMFFIMSVETKSSTLYAALFICFISLLLLSIIDDNNKRRKSHKVVIITLMCSIVILISVPILNNLFWRFVASDPNGMGRFNIWFDAINTFKKSPIFGLGLNAIVQTGSGQIESHNNYIEILINSGIIGLVSYLIFITKSLNSVKKDKYALLVILFFLLYGFGGYSLRRVYFWYLIVTMIYLEKKGESI